MVGSGPKTASGQLLSAPKTITFVTQPPPSPSPLPSPSPSPTPRGVLTGLHLLANVPGGITNVIWSSDSSTVYFIGGKAALESVAATGGNVTVMVLDGVTSAAISPAGDQLAYVRNGKIEILTVAGQAATSEVAPTPAAVIVGWAKGAVEWTAADGVYTQGPDGPVKLTSLPTIGAFTVISLSQDGSHLAYTQDQSLKLIDVATGNSVGLGVAGAPFPGRAARRTRVIFSGPPALVTSDGLGEKAPALLDDSGRKVYAGSNPGLNLLVGGDPSFSRYYLLTQEITGTQLDMAQFVVRLVFSHDKIDVSTYEETLTLVRTQGSQQFLVDQSTIGPTLALGKGAEVVSVEVSPGTVKVTFDSDLQPSTVSAGVIILDSKGKQIGATPVYSSRTVSFNNLDLKPGKTYKLVVLSTVQDVGGNNLAAED